MKKTFLFVSLFLVLAVVTACAPSEEAMLNVGGEDYTRSELENLGTISVDYTNKDGETTTYKGIPLATLLEDAGIGSAGGNIIFTAADGYEAEMAAIEAMACENCIVAFDDNSLLMVMPDFSSKLQVKDVISITAQ